MKKLISCLALSVLIASCWKEQKEEVLGYAPLYGNTEDIKTISLLGPQKLENGGKIYVYGRTLYQVENGKGIHITDITTPASPVKKGFVKVTGAQELAIKENLIYTNNMKDLVIVKLDGNTATTIRRMPETFKALFNNGRPPERGRFECPDPAKGTIIGWQKKMLVNPSCSY